MVYFSDGFFHMIEGIPPDEWIFHAFPLDKVCVLSGFEQTRKAIEAPKSIMLIGRALVSFSLQLDGLRPKHAFDTVLRQQILILIVNPLVVVDLALFKLGFDFREGKLDVTCQLGQPILDEFRLWLSCNEGVLIGKVASLLCS